jgi:hypothetical protein
MEYKEFKEKVNDIVYDINDFMFGEDKNSYEPTWNVEKRKETEKKRAIYAVKFYKEKEIFAVWDWKRHKDLGAGKSWLEISKSWNDIKLSIDEFEPYYKGLKGGKNIEKIYVVGLHNLNKFFQNYDSYMKLNALDDEFPHYSKEAEKEADAVQWFSEAERERYSSSRYKRDAKFRKDVLAAYNYQCAVCRCKAPSLLEAAHERGHEVAHTKYDDSKHGICLCANHHRMYDKFLIDIDLKSCELHITDDGIAEHIENMSWYREFQETYKGRILERSG